MSTTWINRGHFYCPHVRPILVDCNFVVASADTGGLGITSLKGQGIQNVFMHTSQTPGKGPNGLLNPNPQSGVIMVQFADNYQRFYSMYSSLQVPLSGTPLNVDASDAALTAGDVYVIQSLGTSTAEDWLALGVPPGVTPAVGVSFVALVTGAGTGTGTVEAPAAAGAGIFSIAMVGNSNLSIGPIPVGGSPNVGGFVNLACYKDSAADAPTLAAPADGTLISLSFYMNQSNVVVAGE